MIIKILIALLFTGITIFHAYHDALRIKLNLRIYHGINGLVALILLVPVYLYLKDWFFVFGLLCLRRIVFDTALNLIRGLKFDYISSTTTSIIDRLSYDFQKRYGYFIYYSIFFLLFLLSILFNNK